MVRFFRFARRRRAVLDGVICASATMASKASSLLSFVLKVGVVSVQGLFSINTNIERKILLCQGKTTFAFTDFFTVLQSVRHFFS